MVEIDVKMRKKIIKLLKQKNIKSRVLTQINLNTKYTKKNKNTNITV